ncbi:hypothetical protein AB1Y20_004958 [Prymnesium parvum]|uniref:CDAN1-interacting nuclease 1 n=1 Tax=Prymnesium parvum TaxID=97485 RepID=A0AB34J2D9_PRYPA
MLVPATRYNAAPTTSTTRPSLADPRSRVPSPDFRLALLYHLGLPLPGLDPPEALGDRAISTSHHSPRHTDVLIAWYHAALAAHTLAGAIREPTDHSAYSPGKRPDLYLPALNVALDVKTSTGSLFTSKTPAHVASHTPVAATAEVFLLRAFGDPRRGSSGEYTEALRQGTTLRTKVLSSVSASSLRRRVPTCSSSPPLGHPAPRAGGRSFC